MCLPDEKSPFSLDRLSDLALSVLSNQISGKGAHQPDCGLVFISLDSIGFDVDIFPSRYLSLASIGSVWKVSQSSSIMRRMLNYNNYITK